MRLGFISIWGLEMTSVNAVNLMYNGNQESLRFAHEPDKKVSDIRQHFLNGVIQNIYIDIFISQP